MAKIAECERRKLLAAELSGQIQHVAARLDGVFRECQATATVASSAMLALLIEFAVDEIKNGSSSVHAALRLTSERLMRLSESTPDTVDAIRESMFDDARTH